MAAATVPGQPARQTGLPRTRLQLGAGSKGYSVVCAHRRVLLRRWIAALLPRPAAVHPCRLTGAQCACNIRSTNSGGRAARRTRLPQASIWEKQAQLDEEQLQAVEALAGVVSQRPLPPHVRARLLAAAAAGRGSASAHALRTLGSCAGGARGGRLLPCDAAWRPTLQKTSAGHRIGGGPATACPGTSLTAR
jgi:hypothetical protein